ncbi:MAG: MoxR family ATPase [Candidatus Thiodiazotropha sp. (ex Lucinoma borealis)]|nr:MoxR family ATPase [Candidatus Thiodiazotropha sp. (ex Lucinoma borealis)]
MNSNTKSRTQKDKSKIYEKTTIGGTTVRLPPPAPLPTTSLTGRNDIIEKALAAWMALGTLPPLNFRLHGPPGVGKNAIVYELARVLGKDLYIINGHEELGPEDIACTATITSRNTIEYVASPLFAGMYRGSIVFFDEIGKAPPAALDPLASVLDDRRELTSVLAGIRIKANAEFLFCAALNEIEERGVGLPAFLDERTRPAIHVGYPPIATLEQILEAHFPDHEKVWARAFTAEFKDDTLSPRTAITLLGYACRLFQAKNGPSTRPTEQEVRYYLRKLQAETGHDRDEDAASPDSQNDIFQPETDTDEDTTQLDLGNEGPVH